MISNQHQCKMECVTLYHYTSRASLSSILRYGAILSSSQHGHPTGWVGGRDVRQGAVFLTGLDPFTYSRQVIAYNNFGCVWVGALRKTEAWVAVTLPNDHRLTGEFRPDKVLGGQRHVAAWLGGPIWLEGHEHWCGWF